MTFGYRDIVNVIELVVYVPTFLIAIYVAYRHGISRSSGWVFLVFFALIRIVGAVAFLITLTNHAIGIYITAAICEGIGLSPLIMSSVGLLSRVNDSITRNSGKGLPPNIFRLVHLITLTGLILNIIGQTSNTTPEGLTQINTKTKIGVAIFIVAYVLLCLLVLAVGSRRSRIEQGERRLLFATAVSLPFILVRLVYSILTVYVHSSTFNLFSGNVTAQLVMSVLPEFTVVALYLGVGVTLNNLSRMDYKPAPLAAGVPLTSDPNQPLYTSQPTHGNPQQQLDYQGNTPTPNNRNDYYEEDTSYGYQPSRRERRRQNRRRGPISGLIGMAMDMAKERR